MGFVFPYGMGKQLQTMYIKVEKKPWFYVELI